MKLTINWNDFSEKINMLIEKSEELSKTSINSETEFDILKESIKNWNKECYDYLNSSFNSEKNEFAIGFNNSRENRYNLGREIDFKQKVKNLFSDLNSKKSTLKYYLKILKVSDAIIKPDQIGDRAKFSTEETLDLILEKLFDLYDNNYHSVGMILEGNGIVLKRHGEEREFCKILERKGFIKIMSARDISAQLTMNGKMYIEEKRKVQTTDYNHISSSQIEINNKIDEIINELNKVGLGQEIIFDELSEMKELFGTLNKKNWGQLLKGKLFDIGVSQVVNKEVLSMIYKELTQEVLRLM